MKSVIVLDVGTQFVKTWLFEIDKEKQQKNIKFFARERCSEEIFSNCEKTIKKIPKRYRTKSTEILFGLNSDILRGKTITLCLKRENPSEKIDLTELKHFIQKIEWKALDNIRKEFSKETESKDIDIKLIDAFVVSIKIDGHAIIDPIGMQGQNICLSIYNIYTLCKWFNGFEKLAASLKFKIVKLIPISYSLFRHLDLEKSSKSSALIIDIGAKMTEITFINNGGEIIETKNFHLGGQAFSRVLADFLKTKLSNAENIKMKYSKGEVGLGAKKKLEHIFTPNISFWMNGVKIILGDFLREHKILPNKIFICGGGSKFPLIELILKKEKGFKILNLENCLESGEASCWALEKLYSSLPDEKDVFAPIFKRVIKLIQNQ